MRTARPEIARVRDAPYRLECAPWYRKPTQHTKKVGSEKYRLCIEFLYDRDRLIRQMNSIDI